MNIFYFERRGRVAWAPTVSGFSSFFTTLTSILNPDYTKTTKVLLKFNEILVVRV